MVRGLFLTLAVVTLCASSAYQKKEQKRKSSDVEFVDTRVRRLERMTAVDGRLRNAGDKPLRGLVIVFDFLSTDGTPLTTAKTEVEEEVVAPGEDAAFHAETPTPPGAVRYRVRVFDEHDRQLKVANPGPFAIE